MRDARQPRATREEAIRLIFATKRNYSVPETANLLAIDEAALAAEIAEGALATATDRRDYLPWREVAYLALRTWPLDLIFEALGTDAESHLPKLLRPTTITVTLPAYQVRALEVLGQARRMDVSTYLQLHLLDLASAESPSLAAQIPGFLAALQFPFGEEP